MVMLVMVAVSDIVVVVDMVAVVGMVIREFIVSWTERKGQTRQRG